MLRAVRGRAVLLFVLVGLVGACAPDHPAAQPPAASTPARGLYVSIGDSYAVGLERVKNGRTVSTRRGFPDRIVERVGAAGGQLQLLNFACSGATSASLLRARGCTTGAVNGPRYPDSSQADAAVSALAAHRDDVRLVTVVIGGNDVYHCVRAERGVVPSEALSCADAAIQGVRANVRALLIRIRDAVGPQVPVVGLTYPDVFLGIWTRGDPASQNFARASVTLFRDRLNPPLRAEYDSAQARFVDLTEASGAYGPFEQTVELAPYGPLPGPVAQVCRLTDYCATRDVHPTDAGHAAIADQVLAAVPLT